MKKAEDKFVVAWVDYKKEPECPSDPAFPNGIELDVTGGNSPYCKIHLPYPAKRCGLYMIRCKFCNSQVACTTAGRPDDPRSINIPCSMQYKD